MHNKNSDSIIEARKFAANLLLKVVLGKMSVLNALKIFPKNSDDESVNTCFHILVHYESDEELRSKDPLYKETQDEFLVETAQTLLEGNMLPLNIIKEYKDFYNNDLFYKKYTGFGILKRLKRIINL